RTRSSRPEKWSGSNSTRRRWSPLPDDIAKRQLRCENMSEDLLYEVREGIGWITFNRPQARNALTFEMYERTAEICSEVGKDDKVKVLVMTGAGDKAFAAGTDISLFRSFSTPQDALEYEARGDRVSTAIERCQIPTIAAIAGACTGGGAG